MQATLYQQKVIVALDKKNDTYCNWMTQAVSEDEMIKIDSQSRVQVNLEGVVI